MACELQHINTRHPDFVAALSDVTVRLGCLSAPSADFSDDDIEDRRIEEEEDLEDASPAAEPERRGWFGGLRGDSVDAAAAVESPRVLRAEGSAAATLPEAAESESGSFSCGRGESVGAGLLFRRKGSCDLVPKIVMTHVVHKVEEKMQATISWEVAGAEPPLLSWRRTPPPPKREGRRQGARRPARRLAPTRRCPARRAHPRERELIRGRFESAPLTHNNVSTRRRDRSPGPWVESPQRRRRGRGISASSPRARRPNARAALIPLFPSPIRA